MTDRTEALNRIAGEIKRANEHNAIRLIAEIGPAAAEAVIRELLAQNEQFKKNCESLQFSLKSQDNMTAHAVDKLQAENERLQANVDFYVEERKELARQVGIHDPTGIDHVEEMMQFANETDQLRQDNQKLIEAMKPMADMDCMFLSKDCDCVSHRARKILSEVKKDDG